MVVLSKAVRAALLILVGVILTIAIQYVVYYSPENRVVETVQRIQVMNQVRDTELPKATPNQLSLAQAVGNQGGLSSSNVVGTLSQQMLSYGNGIYPQQYPGNDLSNNLDDPSVPGSLLNHVVHTNRIPPHSGQLQNVPQVTNHGTGQSVAKTPNAASSNVPVLALEGGPETIIYRWNGTGWRQLHHFCSGNYNFQRTMLRSPAGSVMINIHDLKDDKWVSGALKQQGLWDLPDVTTMVTNLKKDPELGFIDIGSHVGTFSIVAAIMGRKVAAVDPLVANVLRFCKTVQENGFTNKITIFYTAISDVYRKVSFKKEYGNIGGTRIVSAPSNTDTSNVYDSNYIDTVRLDDLVPYIPFKKAFIKMDVEEHEYQVITSGTKFFKEINVSGILMEWMWQRQGKNGWKLRDFLLALNFKPYMPDESKALDAKNYQTWPSDILWKKV